MFYFWNNYIKKLFYFCKILIKNRKQAFVFFLYTSIFWFKHL